VSYKIYKYIIISNIIHNYIIINIINIIKFNVTISISISITITQLVLLLLLVLLLVI